MTGARGWPPAHACLAVFSDAAAKTAACARVAAVPDPIVNMAYMGLRPLFFGRVSPAVKTSVATWKAKTNVATADSPPYPSVSSPPVPTKGLDSDQRRHGNAKRGANPGGADGARAAAGICQIWKQRVKEGLHGVVWDTNDPPRLDPPRLDPPRLVRWQRHVL